MAMEERPATISSNNSPRIHGGPEAISVELNALVRDFLKCLPKVGDKRTPEAKARWLRALSQNLDFVCDIAGDKGIVIAVRND